MAMMFPLLLLSLLLPLCNYGRMGTALASDATVQVVNLTDDVIYARIFYKHSVTGSIPTETEVPSNGSVNIFFRHNQSLSLFFASRCSFGKSHHLRSCSNGDCPGGGCSQTNPPVATTIIEYVNGTVTISTKFGYNYGLQAAFLHSGDCVSPSISCTIPLNSCPEKLKVKELGLVMACRAGDGLPSGKDCTASSPPSATITCLSKDAILKVTVTSQQ